jgi:hypothetical protein
MFRFFSRKVRVAFIDDATGEQICTSTVPVDQLPDTFAVDTKLDMEGAHYVVVQADPETKFEFAKTRRLRVTLRKVEFVDAYKLLFSVPTICGAARPWSSIGRSAQNVIVLHEDDWRQCEFVADSLHEDISAELSSIRRIHAVAATGLGWREVHVRERIVRPLSRGTTWSAVAAHLGELEPVDGVAFGDRARPVLGAVATRLPDNVILWGVEDGRELAVLCVENLETASRTTIGALKRVADTFSLTLIHWCRCQAYSANSEPIVNAVGTPWDPVV